MATTSAEQMVQALTTASTTEAVYRALVNIRTKLIKQPKGIHDLRKHGGFKYILNYVTKPNMKLLDISLSILGNCCMDAEVRTEVKSLKGISSIVTILKALEMGSIQNRACRTLANLALDKEISNALHEGEVVPVIVNFLVTTKDPLNQQTAVRALRILADTPEHRNSVIRHDGLRAIAEHLTTKDVDVLKALLKTMKHLTDNCTYDCAVQLYADRYLQYLVLLANHADLNIRVMAVGTLVNLTQEKSIRPYLGSAGAMQVFIKESLEYFEGDEKPCGDSPVYALCLCTCEAVNRRRIRNFNGLEALVSIFKKEDQSKLQDRILNTFMNFIWDSGYFKELMALGLISIIVEKLHRYLMHEQSRVMSTSQLPKWYFLPINAPDLEERQRPLATSMAEESDPDTELQEFSNELDWTDKPFRRLNPYQLATYDLKRPNRFENKSRYFYWYNDDDWKSSFQFKYPMPEYSTNTALLDKHDKFFPYVCIPEWISPERSPRNSWEEDFFHRRMFCYHRSLSPRSISPMSTSPCSSTQCYSPCEFSEVEDEGMESDTSSNQTEHNNWRNIIINDDGELQKEKNVAEVTERLSPFDHDRFPSSKPKPHQWWFLDKNQNPRIGQILEIMLHCSRNEKPSKQLLSTSCMEGLLNCLMSAQIYQKPVEAILVAVAGNKLCLEWLLLMHFPDQMNIIVISQDEFDTNIREVAHKVLGKMTAQIYSPFGFGEIERLMTGNHQLSAVLMVPFLMERNQPILKKFYLDKNGLEMMMSVLADPQHRLFEVAIRSCCKIYYTLAVKPEPAKLRSFDGDDNFDSRDVDHPCLYKRDGQPKDVTFILDNEKTVKANRATLSKNCEVFDVMLQGHFSEAASDTVRFRESSSFALEYVVHFIYGCDYVYDILKHDQREKLKGSVRCPLFSENIADLFEVFALGDRLLLPNLQNQVHEKIIRLIDHKPHIAFEVYCNAMDHRMAALAKRLISYVTFFFYQHEQAAFWGMVLRRSEDCEFALTTIRDFLSVEIPRFDNEHGYWRAQ